MTTPPPTLFVSEPWYSLIEHGKKTVEGRARDYLWWLPHVHGKILVVCADDPSQSHTRTVTDLRWYENLEKYLAAEWKKAAPQANSIEDARALYDAVMMERDGQRLQVFSVERVCMRGGMCALELA